VVLPAAIIWLARACQENCVRANRVRRCRMRTAVSGRSRQQPVYDRRVSRRVSAALRNSRPYYNLCLHMRVQAAEIFKRSSVVESEAEFVLGIERRRTKRTIQ
jgi:hypothetical protein